MPISRPAGSAQPDAHPKGPRNRVALGRDLTDLAIEYPLRQGIGMQDHLLPHPHPRDVLLVHVGRDPQRRTAGQREHRLAHRDELTDLAVAADDEAIGGCREGHETALRLGAPEHCLGRPQLGAGLVHFDGRHDLARHQLLHALKIQPRQECPGLQLLHRVGEVRVIEPGERLPLVHLIAFVGIEFGQIPRRPRGNRQHDRGLHGAGRVDRLHCRTSRITARSTVPVA